MDENFHPAKPKNNLDYFSKFVGKTVLNGKLYKAIFILVASFLFLWSMSAAFAADVPTCSTADNALAPVDDVSSNDGVVPIDQEKKLTSNPLGDPPVNGVYTPRCYPSADIAVSKEFWDGSEANKCAHIPVTTSNYGSNVWSVVKVTNYGPNMVGKTIVTDKLPVGLVYLSHAIFNGTDHILGNPAAFNPATGQWTINNLKAGSTYYLGLYCLVNKTGKLTNMAEKTCSSIYDPNRCNDRAWASLCVPPAADISVSKEFWDGSEANKCLHIPVTTSNYGSNVWAVVKVTNNGPNMVAKTIVTDTLPMGLVYIAHAIFNGTDHILGNPAAFNPATGQWTINNLNAGASYYLGLYCLVNKTGTLTNIANKTCSSIYDPNTTNNNASASLTVPPAADVCISKEFWDGSEANKCLHIPVTTSNFGSNVWAVVKVTNNGPDMVPTMIVTDKLPVGLVYIAHAIFNGTDHILGNPAAFNPATGQWTINNLNAGASYYLGLYCLVNKTGEIHNMAEITCSSIYDPNKTNDRTWAGIKVPPAADIAVSKEFWDGSEANKCLHIPVTMANYGSNVWAVVKVTNNGPDMVPTTIVTDTLPVGLVYIAHAIFNGTDHILGNPAAFNPATGQWTINNLNAGASYYLGLYCLVNKTGTLTNIANKTCSSICDPNATNNNASANLTVPPAADLELTKTVDKTTAFVGDIVNFTFIVQNKGPDQAVNVTVTDKMPEGLLFQSYTANYGTYDSTTGVWTIDVLPADAIAQLVVTSLVENSGFKINNATVTSLTYDPVLTNNNASASFDALDGSAAGGGDEPTGDGNDGTTTVGAQEVSMQETGMPIAALVLAILMVLAGTFSSRKK